MKRRVHQLTNAMIPGDAVSTHILEIDARLRHWGFETGIYADYIDPEMGSKTHSQEALVPYLDDPDALLIYHYSIYNANVRLFQAARGRRLLVYHNITPSTYFMRWDSKVAMRCEIGRRVLGQLTSCDLAVGVSEFNRRELVAAGFAPDRTGVLPILLPEQTFVSLQPNSRLLFELGQSDRVNWLTVGRIVPNKALEDAIRIFAVYYQAINPDSTLHIVGSQYVTTYVAALRELVAALDLDGAVNFAGRVSDADLAAYYRAADLYITASHHEGFCVPLLESMYFGVPVLARKAAAIPETLGACGMMFTDLGYEHVAEAAHLLISDTLLRDRIIAGQRQRLVELGPDRAEAMLQIVLARLGLLAVASGGPYV